MQTSELSGAALDWAVAKATGAREIKLVEWGGGRTVSCIYLRPDGGCWANHYSPSTEWDQGGLLLDKYRLQVAPWLRDQWTAMTECGQEYGATPLEAICRAIVAAKLGDDVTVPPELLD